MLFYTLYLIPSVLCFGLMFFRLKREKQDITVFELLCLLSSFLPILNCHILVVEIEDLLIDKNLLDATLVRWNDESDNNKTSGLDDSSSESTDI